MQKKKAKFYISLSAYPNDTVHTINARALKIWHRTYHVNFFFNQGDQGDAQEFSVIGVFMVNDCLYFLCFFYYWVL